MKSVLDGDISMVLSFIIFVVLETFLIWYVQTYQNKLGSLIFLCNHFVSILRYFLGSIGIFMIQYSFTFLFELFWYTIFPLIILIKSWEDYYQLWTGTPSKQVWSWRLNWFFILNNLIPKENQFFVSHPGFSPRDSTTYLQPDESVSERERESDLLNPNFGQALSLSSVSVLVGGKPYINRTIYQHPYGHDQGLVDIGTEW
jgi:hypothetical protein